MEIDLDYTSKISLCVLGNDVSYVFLHVKENMFYEFSRHGLFSRSSIHE